MIISSSVLNQDTIQSRNVILPDSLVANSDSVSVVNPFQKRDSVIRTLKQVPKEAKSDFINTTAVCSRNNVADITFYNSNNILTKSGLEPINKFPFLFIEKTKRMKIDARMSIIKHLKSGEGIATNPLHDDWIIGIVLITMLLYSLIRTASRGVWPGVIRFFLFRGINDPSSRDIDSIFQWQSTIHNLSTFLITALFAYFSASYYNLIPLGISGVLFWLICLSIIFTAITIRHIVCIITGNLSGEKEVFREYLVSIYQSYRYSALFLFAFIILMSYTPVLSAKISITAGTIVFGTMYIIRVLRLLMIFMNRNISIFYLILYLCALEILPVLISVKYITGLI